MTTGRESPRSILRSRRTLVAPRVAIRRRIRRRRVSFSATDEVFFIPNRKALREDQRKALRRRRLRRQLTMRTPTSTSRRTRLRRKTDRRRKQPPPTRTRVNRLARARRRYLSSRRGATRARRQRAARHPPQDQNSN